MPQWIVNLIGLIAFVLVLALAVSPLVLVLQYPESGEDIAEIAKILIPWLIILLLLLIFNEGIKTFLTSIAQAISRIRKVSAVGTTAELGFNQESAVTLTDDQLAALQQQMQAESSWAWHFFFKYITATIFGSQLKALMTLLDEGPKKPHELVEFYNLFLSRAGGDVKYPFQSWVEYMTSNLLLAFNDGSGVYQITDHGKTFVEGVRSLGYDWDHFSN